MKKEIKKGTNSMLSAKSNYKHKQSEAIWFFLPNGTLEEKLYTVHSWLWFVRADWFHNNHYEFEFSYGF